MSKNILFTLKKLIVLISIAAPLPLLAMETKKENLLIKCKTPPSLASQCREKIINEWQNLTELDDDTIAAAQSVDSIDCKDKEFFVNSLIKDQMQEHVGYVWAGLLLSPDGKRILYHHAKKQLLEIKERTTDKLISLEGINDQFKCLQWSQQGNRIACWNSDQSRAVKIWDSNSGALLNQFKCSSIPFIKFTPDEQKIIIKEYYQPLKFYDIQSGALCRTMGAAPFNNEFDITPDGRHVILGEYVDSKLYNSNTGEIVKVVRGGKWPHFSSNGKYVITLDRPFIGENDKIIITDVETNKVIKTINMSQNTYGYIVNPYCNRIKIYLNNKTRNTEQQDMCVPYINPFTTPLSAILAYKILKNNKDQQQELCTKALTVLKENKELHDLFQQDGKLDLYPEYIDSRS